MRCTRSKDYCLLLLVLCCFYAKAQNTGKKFSITLNGAILRNQAALQPGFGYRSGSWGLTGEVSTLSASKLDFDGGHWTRGQLELKRYFSPRADRWYISFQTAFSSRRFIDKDSGFFFTNMSDTGASYSSAIIHSPVLSFAPKIGVEWALGKTFFLDMFVGMGVRIIYNRYDAQDVHPMRVFHKREWGPDGGWQFDQTVTRFHVPVGLRLGLRL